MARAQRPETPPVNSDDAAPGAAAPSDALTGPEIIASYVKTLPMKPGVYRAEKVDPPMPEKNQQHIFAVNGSGNHFDLRGVVIETPVSVQSQLTNKAHVADSWHINGHDNTFEGGYFRNVVDRPYGKYNVTENEFEVPGDRNVFINCTFVIKGSVPYGYSDFYGKGSSRWGRLDKHSFMSISGSGTELIGCAVYQQSYGHGVHFHGADGALIKDCYLTGTLRPTNDIYKEKVGRAKQFDFNIMYRGQRPIPRDQMIPLTEDGIRTYGGDKNIQVINTTVERFRCGAQIHAEGHIVLRNVTVRLFRFRRLGRPERTGHHAKLPGRCRLQPAVQPDARRPAAQQRLRGHRPATTTRRRGHRRPQSRPTDRLGPPLRS